MYPYIFHAVSINDEPGFAIDQVKTVPSDVKCHLFGQKEPDWFF